jgi:uncharacterized protein (DUF1330 family)
MKQQVSNAERPFSQEQPDVGIRRLGLTIHDRATFERYLAEAPQTVARFGGKYLFRGDDVTALEGSWDDERLVILEFETAEAAQAWYRSAEYERLRELRQSAADAVILLAGAQGGEGAHRDRPRSAD